METKEPNITLMNKSKQKYFKEMIQIAKDSGDNEKLNFVYRINP